MQYDALIVGGGIAGLTAAAFLSKEGHNILICEKERKLGGLVGSFERNGFVFDGGIRAIEDSGIVQPMLRQLGINVDFLDNPVSVGIEDDIITFDSKKSLQTYRDLLIRQFPEKAQDIKNIIDVISKIMQNMDIMYGVDNPIFLDIKKDRDYFIKTVFPWLFKFIFTIGKVNKLNEPVEDYLKKLTDDPVLIDMIAQHFFKNTPTSFALSYISLYLDYAYPKGGTGVLIDKITDFIKDHNGKIMMDTTIEKIDIDKKEATDQNGTIYSYKKLIWAADLKALYNVVDIDSVANAQTKKAILDRKAELSNMSGGDSVFTLYISADIDRSVFADIHSPHLFYTPYKKGLSNINIDELKIDTSDNVTAYTKDKEAIFDWVKRYCELTTFEISIPVLRDESLAPKGQTGLIVSTLMDHSLVKHIADMGWYEEFKELCQDTIIDILDATVYPSLKEHIIDAFTSTPLTIEKRTGNSDGAITGWAFTNRNIPAVNDLKKVSRSVLTPIPNVLQAGQWSYSPSGFPISILTGKLAANRVIKELK